MNELIQIIKFPNDNEKDKILNRAVEVSMDLNNKVKNILLKVKSEGDDAIRKFTNKFDNVNLTKIDVSKTEIDRSEDYVNEELKKAINIAKDNIEKFHKAQKINVNIIETSPGVKCWRKDVAIEKVGLYVPGGTAPLFSTVLMLGIPAKLAGCNEIVICTPASEEGEINPIILYTAKILGINKVYQIGGAQAIGAMAFGTETVPKVNKIFGPGNQWVTTAKMLVNMEGIAIDIPAGPSEVMVVADESANPKFIAADLLSQAEHGSDSQSILLTTSELIISETLKEIKKQIEYLPRKKFIESSLKNSRMVLLDNEEKIIELMNDYAPEHLIVSMHNAEEFSEGIINAGSVFIGNYTPESAGDYASGTNHTLPTSGYAKSYSGVSLDSFFKKITYQKISREGLKNLGPTIEIMAEAEHLLGHKNAVSVRLKEIEKGRTNE